MSGEAEERGAAKKPADASAAARLPPSPVLWLIIGSLLTLSTVLVLRLTHADAPAPEAAASPSPMPARAAPAGPAGEQFAELYMTYLLRSYYVDARGFCPKLLAAICDALVRSELIVVASRCEGLPNEELVLAIGRYQHQVGLPVDGKAGPETVRMILGGDFSSRREMAASYCPGVAIDSPAPAPASSSSARP